MGKSAARENDAEHASAADTAMNTNGKKGLEGAAGLTAFRHVFRLFMQCLEHVDHQSPAPTRSSLLVSCRGTAMRRTTALEKKMQSQTPILSRALLNTTNPGTGVHSPVRSGRGSLWKRVGVRMSLPTMARRLRMRSRILPLHRDSYHPGNQPDGYCGNHEIANPFASGFWFGSICHGPYFFAAAS